jgi:hypothetical protein
MVVGIESLSFDGQWWCSALTCLAVVYGLGFESLTFGGQWWCSAWSWVRIFDFLGLMVV